MGSIQSCASGTLDVAFEQEYLLATATAPADR